MGRDHKCDRCRHIPDKTPALPEKESLLDLRFKKKSSLQWYKVFHWVIWGICVGGAILFFLALNTFPEWLTDETREYCKWVGLGCLCFSTIIELSDAYIHNRATKIKHDDVRTEISNHLDILNALPSDAYFEKLEENHAMQELLKSIEFANKSENDEKFEIKCREIRRTFRSKYQKRYQIGNDI